MRMIRFQLFLSEHEIVIPRSITMGQDPVRNSAQFVAQTFSQTEC